MRRSVAFVVGLVLALLPLVPAAADLRATGVLTGLDTVVRWSGEFTAAAAGPVAPSPATCAAAPVCDQVSLQIDVPADMWEGAPGGLVVAVQWPAFDFSYDLDLHLYRAGEHSPVASSVSLASRYEALWIPNPSPGLYLAVVSAKQLVAQPIVPKVLTPIRYDGSARIERGLTVERLESNLNQEVTRRFVAFDKQHPDGAQLLPDLVPTKPSGFHVESGWGAHYYFYGDRGVRHQPSCYPQETAGLTADEPRPGVGALRCLRWDQGEHNLGDGPFELHNYPDHGPAMWQRVYSADGGVAQRQVGETVFSSAHGHLHYLGFNVVSLHQIAPDGGLGALVVRAPDKGMCFVDIEVASLHSDRNSPLSYGFPGTCDAATHRDSLDPTYPGHPFFTMGISVGAADIYPWYIADQYVDVTSVPDGRYLLRVEIDAGGKLMEKSRANNVATSCVDLRGQQAVAC
jgi:lysyl oxidase